MNQRTKRTALFVFLAAAPCLFMCAKEGMPPGGPEDTTPPEIVWVSPSAGATEVPLDSKIEFTFSERMMPKITEESIFVSPLPKEPFEFHWKGKKLVLVPAGPLHPDRTYVVSVGADAQDMRRNRLGLTYSLAFSTGSRLDLGTISGQVWVKQQIGVRREAGASVWAYLLHQAESEADPATVKPDYVTQTDEQGTYVLKNLSLGTYRLFAVQDLNRDLIWNWETESIGMTTHDPELTEQAISAGNVRFVLDRKDRQNPALSDCYALNRHMVRLEFNEELDRSSALNRANYRITPTAGREPVEIHSVFLQDEDARSITLLTEETTPGEDYELTVLTAADKAGNPVDTSADGCRFTGSGMPDTVGPEITKVKPADREVNVPLDVGIAITFSEPPNQQAIETSFFLLDPADINVAGNGQWVDPNTYLFTPDSLLAGGTRFRVELPGSQIRDSAGNPWKQDSVFTSMFTTVSPETLGSVSGRVSFEGEAGAPHTLLTLWQLGQGGVLYRVTLSGPGPFRFDRVLPGKYFLAACLDLNQDGLLSLGQPEPYSPLEPFEVYPDTIWVRSRWETEAVELTLRTRQTGEDK